MEEPSTQQPVQEQQATPKLKVEKHKKASPFLWVFLVATLILGTAFTVYVWQQAEVGNLQAQVNDLNRQVASLESPDTPVDETDVIAPATYVFKLEDMKKALGDCSISAKSVSDIKTAASNQGTPANSLSSSESGRINTENSWAFVEGGCGSQAMSFTMARLADNSWVTIDKSWSSVPICSSVDGSGVPAEVIGVCLEEDNGDKVRNIE